MTNRETMNILMREVRRVSGEGVAGLQRNKHLCNPPEGMTQEHLDAALCGLVNSYAYYCCGMDYALHAGALRAANGEPEKGSSSAKLADEMRRGVAKFGDSTEAGS